MGLPREKESVFHHSPAGSPLLTGGNAVLPPQSYGPEHLLTFHNLKHLGLLTEQAPGETLTAVESKVSKLVTDKAAGEWSSCCFPDQHMAGVPVTPAGCIPSMVSSRAAETLCSRVPCVLDLGGDNNMI